MCGTRIPFLSLSFYVFLFHPLALYVGDDPPLRLRVGQTPSCRRECKLARKRRSRTRGAEGAQFASGGGGGALPLRDVSRYSKRPQGAHVVGGTQFASGGE